MTTAAYAGHFTADEAGSYRFTGWLRQGRTPRARAEGMVLADSRGADMDHAELRVALLKRIASETGGKYYPVDDLSHLPDDVLLTDSGITAHESRDLWDMPAVLLLLIILLGAEWSYRRWRGLA